MKGYNQAIDDLVPKLQTELSHFQERLKADTAINVENKPGYAGQGSGALDGWTLTLVGMLAGLVLSIASDPTLLAFDRLAIVQGELWRLWTGHLIHFSAHHLVMDLCALLLTGALTEQACRTKALVIALGAAMPILSVGLLLRAPLLMAYRGSSGLAMLCTAGCATQLWRAQPRLRLSITCLGLALAFKVAYDAHVLPWYSPLTTIPVVWRVHVMGAAGGWLAFRRQGPS